MSSQTDGKAQHHVAARVHAIETNGTLIVRRINEDPESDVVIESERAPKDCRPGDFGALSTGNGHNWWFSPYPTRAALGGGSRFKMVFDDLIRLSAALVEGDKKEACPLCGKKDWGEDLHGYGCPVGTAYEMLKKWIGRPIDETAIF